MRLDQAARSVFLKEFVSAFVLAMRYFFKPKATLNYPFENRNSAVTLRDADGLVATGGVSTFPSFSR